MRLKKSKISKNPIQIANQKISIKKAPIYNKNANQDAIKKKIRKKVKMYISIKYSKITCI
jgi:hypothetical protein